MCFCIYFQVSALQRAGRAGRTGPGQCYRLYSSECFDGFMDETVPEILRTNLSNTVLYLKALSIRDIIGFDFLDAPSEDQIIQAQIDVLFYFTFHLLLNCHAGPSAAAYPGCVRR